MDNQQKKAEAERLCEVYQHYAIQVRELNYDEVPEGIFSSIEQDITALGYEIVREPHKLPIIREIVQ